MARYVSLIRFTEQGASALKHSTKRAHAFNQAAAKSGAKVEAQYWTLGAYDGVLVLSAPRPEQALRCLAELAADGNVKTETMQAFDDKDFAAIVGAA